MNKILVALLFISCVFGSASAQSGRARQVVDSSDVPVQKTQSSQTSTGSSSSVGSSSSSGSSSTIDNSRPPVLQRQTSTNSNPKSDTPKTTNKNEKVEVINDDNDVLRVDTASVTIPVSVLDRNGHFIPNLKQQDFKIFEDNQEQEVAYFGTTETPFTVVLLIDVSPSTKFKIDEIHNAAINFVNQLKPNDKVMVISFDKKVHVLSETTNDRNRIARAINEANFGDGTSLYDAVDYVLTKRLNGIQGRKAIVLFTDGVDTTSKRMGYEESVREAEESSAAIYPIYYDTADYVQSQSGGGGGMGYPTGNTTIQILGGIFGGGGGNRRGGNNGGVFGNGAPTNEDVERGELYLEDLAKATGGTKYNTNSTRNLETAFLNIAEELRRQYTIGYYPQEVGKIGQRKQIKVRVDRPNLIVQARDSYIVGESENKPVAKFK